MGSSAGLTIEPFPENDGSLVAVDGLYIGYIVLRANGTYQAKRLARLVGREEPTEQAAAQALALAVRSEQVREAEAVLECFGWGRPEPTPMPWR